MKAPDAARPLRRLPRAVWVLAAVFLLQWVLVAAPAVPRWDGAFYYAYARSPVFDGDLYFANDIEAAFPTSGDHFPEKGYEADFTATGYVANVFAPGAALLWLPWVAAVQTGARLLGVGDLTGYEWFFVQVAGSVTALGGLAAFGLAWWWVSGVFGRKTALLATVTLMFATPLLYYQFREPFYSHAASALSTTLALVYWWHSRDRAHRPAPALALGMLIGLAALVRWQHVLYFAVPLVDTAWQWLRHDRTPGGARVHVRRLLLTGAGLLLVLTVQFAVWWRLYGTWLTVPQGSEFMRWDLSFVGPLFFSPFRGLVPWMPVVIPALLGLALLVRRRPELALPLLAVFVLESYINGSTPDWFAGGGYGPRRYSSELALFVFGYAALLDGVRARLRPAAAALLGGALAWQQWALLRYALDQRLGGRVMSMFPTFDWQESSWGEFADALLALLPNALRAPRAFWVFPDSPLGHLLATGTLPGVQVAGLALALGVAAALAAAAWATARRLTPARRLALAVALIVAVDVWIVLAA